MRLGRVAGTTVVIHPSFWLLVAFVGFIAVRAGLGASAVASEIVLLLAVVACVVLHEFGHALAARRCGIRTESITLYPIGGVARLERIPERPAQELMIALAGPMVNAGIAAILGVSLLFVHSGFVVRLALVNAFLVLFNLLPAFPMDGGRVLRALLALRLPYPRATRIAAGIGKAMVVPFVLAGFVWNPFLIAIGLFVWLGASSEAQAVTTRASLADARVLQAAMGHVLVLEPQDRLAHAIELTLNSPQKDFPVTQNGEVIGSLTQRDLLRSVKKRGPDAMVADVMQGSPPSVEATGRLSDAVELMQRTGVPFLPVTDRGRAVGILSLDNVEEFVRLRAAGGGRTPIRLQYVSLQPEPALPN